MQCYVGNTDYDWYRFLSSVPNLEEVNFWRPLGDTAFRALRPGEPFFFKLKQQYGHAVVGFGLFVMFKPLRCVDAWEAFREGNGAESFEQMWRRIAVYLQHFDRPAPSLTHTIGCILLASPVFFPKELWITGPSDWHRSIVSGKGYDTTSGEGKRLWRECLARASAVDLTPAAAHNIEAIKEAPGRYGTEYLVRARLGQGTFRYAVERAYRKCAVTGEHSLPALEAAHIYPYSLGGPHEVGNGMLFRADIHRLFDRGYVTVTPNYAFKVSRKLEEEFRNGKIYYAMNGRRISLPSDESERPNREYLEYHHEKVFLDHL